MLILIIREIFGPILPVVEVENVEEAIDIINNGYVYKACYYCLHL